MSAAILTDRNGQRADELRQASKDLTPTLRTIVITCADHRVDPAHVLGLNAGEAIVLRNPGGRVTRDLLRSLLVLSTVGRMEQVQPGFEIVVMHHTDCGLSRLDGPEHAALVADFVGVPSEDVSGLALADPWRSAVHDAGLLAGLLESEDSTVLAAVYDLATGRVELLN